jgi:glycosyltransferase 2 family protein
MRAKKIAPFIGGFVALASIAFLLYTLAKYIGEIPFSRMGSGALVCSLAGIILLTLFFVALPFAWKHLLRGGGYHITPSRAYIVMGRSQVAKYFPGNVLQYVGRVALAKSYDIPSDATIMSVGVETIVMACTALLLSTPLLWPDGNLHRAMMHLSSGNQLTIPGIVLPLLVFAALLLVIFSRRARNWLKMRLSYFHLRLLLPAAGLYVLWFLVYGPIIVLIVKVFWSADPSLSWYEYSFGFSLAWLAGFIVPGAPGGIGIREAVFIGLFGPTLGEGVAAGTAVLLRVMTTLSDLITFGVAWLLGRYRG